MWRASITCLFVLASPVAAQTPMSGAEFEAYVTGRTLTYSLPGDAVPFGIEEYRENRRVRWSYFDDECLEGEWYPSGDMICFEYEPIRDPQCWTFFNDGAGLRARFMNDPDATELYETRATDGEMLCLGPKVGS